MADQANTRTPRQRAITFFAEHGGYATPPGRMICARNLADAESYARGADWEVTWEVDDDGTDMLGDHGLWCDDERRGRPHFHDVELAALRDADGEILGVLGGIIDASFTYRRVVAAELAAEVAPRGTCRACRTDDVVTFGGRAGALCAPCMDAENDEADPPVTCHHCGRGRAVDFESVGEPICALCVVANRAHGGWTEEEG